MSVKGREYTGWRNACAVVNAVSASLARPATGSEGFELRAAQRGLGDEGAGRIGRAALALVGEPHQARDFRTLAREAGRLLEELVGVDRARGDLARHAHQLLLVFDQAQADLLLRDLGVALDRLPVSRSNSSLRKYQNAKMIAARNSSTDISGAERGEAVLPGRRLAAPPAAQDTQHALVHRAFRRTQFKGGPHGRIIEGPASTPRREIGPISII